MKKLLNRLPLEGLLIIIIVLISLIILLFITKINSVKSANGDIVVNNVVKDDVLFIETEPEPVIIKDDVKDVEETPEEKRKVRIFFIKVNNDGEIITKGVLKNIYVGKTPLTKTLERLLIGPDTKDTNAGLLSLIPEGTKILSISIRDGVAFINFNEEFMFNPLGVEGKIAQIKQVVYTASEFESVNSVQFLIDGSIYEFLGPEGVYIGRPLSITDLE